MPTYGLQIAFVTFFGNWRERLAAWRSRGYIAVLDHGGARIHQAVSRRAS